MQGYKKVLPLKKSPGINVQVVGTKTEDDQIVLANEKDATCFSIYIGSPENYVWKGDVFDFVLAEYIADCIAEAHQEKPENLIADASNANVMLLVSNQDCV